MLIMMLCSVSIPTPKRFLILEPKTKRKPGKSKVSPEPFQYPQVFFTGFPTLADKGDVPCFALRILVELS